MPPSRRQSYMLNLRPGVALCIASLVLAQSEQAPAFEVVSIKPDTTGHPSGMFPTPSTLTIGNRTLTQLLSEVYRLRQYQVVGADGWMKTEVYDIVGKAAGRASFSQMIEMVKTMLPDRFHLRFHRESRETRGYWLIIAKGGSQLRRPDPNDTHLAGITNSAHSIQGWKQPVSMLVSFLGDEIQIPITDKTGLDGLFDFKLEWTDEVDSPRSDALPDVEKPSLVSAVQEQLGFKLEIHLAPVEVLVIDHADKPSGN